MSIQVDNRRSSIQYKCKKKESDLEPRGLEDSLAAITKVYSGSYPAWAIMLLWRISAVCGGSLTQSGGGCMLVSCTRSFARVVSSKGGVISFAIMIIYSELYCTVCCIFVSV